MDSLNEIFKEGTLGLSQKQGVITLIPKKDKDTQLLKNWRPITLFNTDYKILTKYLAWHLKDNLQNIINYNQKGFLSNRYIGENINNTINLIDYCEKYDIDALLIFVDYYKAFDCVEWLMIETELWNFLVLKPI